MRQGREFAANADQPRRIYLRVAGKLELEITRTRIFIAVGNAALAFDPVVEADSMANRDAIATAALCQEPRDVLVREVRREARIDTGDVDGHAVKEIGACAAQQRIENGL